MEEKEPFIGAADRPNVELNPDQPIAQLTVRQFSSLLGTSLQAKAIAVEYKRLKPEIKEIKIEKFEKFEKFEIKEFKIEKFEKNEKIEIEVDKRVPEIPGPGPEIFDDPRFKQLIDVISQLNRTVQTLDERVKKLEQPRK